MMVTTRGTERLAGGLLIVSFTLILGHVVTGMTLGAGRNTIVWVFAYGFFVGLAGAALYETFRAHDATLAALGAFGLGAHSVLVVITAALLLAGLRFPQEFATFGGETGLVELSMVKIRASSFAFLGLGLVPLGALLIGTRVVARWIGWLGLFSGFLVSIVMFLLAAGLWSGFSGIALFTFGFMLILGIRLLARKLAEGTLPTQ